MIAGVLGAECVLFLWFPCMVANLFCFFARSGHEDALPPNTLFEEYCRVSPVPRRVLGVGEPRAQKPPAQEPPAQEGPGL